MFSYTFLMFKFYTLELKVLFLVIAAHLKCLKKLIYITFNLTVSLFFIFCASEFHL